MKGEKYMYKKILIDILNHPDYHPKTLDELLNCNPILLKNKFDVLVFMEELKEKQILYRLPDNTYALAKNLYIGKFEQYSRYFGFVVTANPSLKDLYIPQENINNAFHGDYVIAKEVLNGFSNGKKEGVIIYVIEDEHLQILGTLFHNQDYGIVVPDNISYRNIFIPRYNLKNAQDKQKVVVEITKRPTNLNKMPEGKIVEVLGYPTDPGVDILSIVKQYSIRTEFPHEVIKEIENLPDAIPENELKEELKHRIDLRDEIVITIDGEDTKDFDDAISIKKIDKDKYLLGVHIADVAHYVKEDSFLDKEARKRGTSVYLVDRVIPMLPEKLSNGLCSLNPKVDRFALSCFMEIDKKGNVLDSKICETVIRVTERMTYANVKKIIEREDNELIQKYKHILQEIDLFYELSRILKNKRKDRGAIDFEFPEAKVIINEQGKPVDIVVKTSDVATQLIEELMIVCNETVSEFFTKKNIPFLYRIHEKPSAEKIEHFLKFMEAINYPVKEKEISPKVLQNILENAKDKPEYSQICYVILRSLTKAKYSPDAKGHFGLASAYYSHFTSPIRRYPDLQIHRIIKEYLHGRLTDERKAHYKQILNDVAYESTEREITASSCEWDVKKYKMCEYMLDKIGQVFEGTVSWVTENGIFVVLPNQVEGFIPAENLDTEKDIFYFEKNLLSYISSDKNKIYTFGTPVKVKVENIHLLKQKIQFSLIKQYKQSA